MMFSNGRSGSIRVAVLALIAIVLVASTSTVFAHGILDQENFPDIIGVYSCGGNGDAPPIGLGSLFQGFVMSPEATHIVGVDVGLSRGGSFPSRGTTTEIKIRLDGPFGSVLAESEAFVAAGPNVPVHFDFDPIEVVPGQTYVIEWINHDMGPMWLAWIGHAVDSYPPAEAFHCGGGTYDPTVDFNFGAYRQESGVCCLPDDECIEVFEVECDDMGGIAGPSGATCAEDTCPFPPVPATSGWGSVVLTLLLLAASALLFRRLRVSSASTR